MNECENNISSPRQKLAASGFLWILAGLSFLVYPLAVFPPALHIGPAVLFNLVHTVSIPGAVLLGLMAIPVLFFLPWRLPRPLMWAVAAFAVMLLVNVPGEVEQLNAFFLLFAYIAIPLAAAVLLAYGYLDIWRMSIWAGLLWGLQIVLGGIALYRGMEPVGTAGNINWMAGLLLMLSPWVVFGFFDIARRWVPHRKTAMVMAAAVWFAPTAVILHHCQSRAAWLAIGLLPAALIVVRMRRRLHKIVAMGLLVAAAVGCLVVAYVHFPGRLLQVVEKDVRLPLWTGTGVMVAKHPLLGVGPGEYQKAFTPLRRVSSYQNRLYAADMTVHPHNEALNVGAQLGIPAMLAFLAMLAMAFRSAGRDPLQVCARISAYFAVALSMFDMTLVQPPSSFLGFFFLGLCWPVSVPAHRQGANNEKWPALKTALSGIVVCSTLVILGADLFHDVHMRRGALAESLAYHHMDANRRVKGQAALEDAIGRYKMAVTPFSRIVPYYKISRLSLMLPDAIVQAEDYLHRVAAKDPNFSHVNLLLGQLHLKKGDWAAAEGYFSRECRFYPRSEQAWQNMYAFLVASGQYGRLDTVEALLDDIYRERARQNFGAGGLAAGMEALENSLPGDDPEALRTAGELLDRINHAFTDPLFFSIARGRSWPPAFVDKGFTVLDAASWRLRRALHAAMQEDLGPLPAAPPAVVSWFSGHIAIEPQGQPAFPLGVWNRRAGNALSVYLLFSMACELNRYPSIICTDGEGQPVRAYLFARQPADGTTGRGDPGGVDIFEVDLSASGCRPVALSDFRNRFQWRSGRTFAYFHTTDYFLRNQILGSVVQEETPWMPHRPPSGRLLELFALTGTVPPPPSFLARFCFDGHILRHLADIDALGLQQAR